MDGLQPIVHVYRQPYAMTCDEERDVVAIFWVWISRCLTLVYTFSSAACFDALLL